MLFAAPIWARSDGTPQISADQIMARVAVNQDRAQKQRDEYIYRQHIRIATRHPNGKLIREETTDYAVTPTPAGTKKELKEIEGRYFDKQAWHEFHAEPIPAADTVDGSIIRGFRDDLGNDKSKDGIAKDLFPLTSEKQKEYQFTLLGERTVNGRPAFRIAFRPKDKNNLTWAGEALIDEADFQPVQVFTKLSRRIPFLVRSLLGTDLPGLGFNVEYQRFAGGVWFPVSFGTEFRLHALFFFNREIAISLENSDFRHTEIESSIEYAPAQ